MENDYLLGVYIDRYDQDYQGHLAKLLSKERLIADAEPIKSNEPRHAGYTKRITVRFCGLSGLSMLGGTEIPNVGHPKAVDRFLGLILNEDGIVDELNKAGIYVDIKVLFAYPYSDFMYDLIQAENTFQPGFSTECVLKGTKSVHAFSETKQLTYEDLLKTISYKHLISSLEKLQGAVNESRALFNHKECPNRVIVKFTPLNILVCYLKINKHIFIDPYLYAKEKKGSQFLSLRAPISFLRVNMMPGNKEAQQLTDERAKLIMEHYASLVSHFRYLWRHQLTMYSTDATHYDKNVNSTLSQIKQPDEISYLGKAKRIAKISEGKYSGAEIDHWKQRYKDELARYCMKFLESKDAVSKDNHPIPIIIVGTWARNPAGDGMDRSDYMHAIEAFIDKYFGSQNSFGLKLSPSIVDANDGENIPREVFKQLHAAQLGMVILSADVRNGSGRPNIYFERGFITGKLQKRRSRGNGNKKDLVFIFRQRKRKEASDVQDIATTVFTNIDDFRLQFFRFVKWLWDVTELNSEYAVAVIKECLVDMETQSDNKTKNRRWKRMAESFISVIEKWEEDYDKRAKRLEDK